MKKHPKKSKILLNILLSISILFCFACSKQITKEIDISNIQECIDPGELDIKGLPINNWNEEHICSPEEISKLVQTISLLKNHNDLQKNALNCYKNQFNKIMKK